MASLIPNSLVQNKQVMLVDESSPLAKIPPSHPLYGYIKVVSKNAQQEVQNLDLTGDSLVSGTPETVVGSVELLGPNGISVGSRVSSFRKSIDGTIRISMVATFEPIVGASDYEVRISGVE